MYITKRLTVLIFAAVYVTLGRVSEAKPKPNDIPHLKVISRMQWDARTPKKRIPNLVTSPVPYVIIHHSATSSCETQAICQREMRSIQNHHIDTEHWSDIAYNFLVGEDGNVYEARGWHKQAVFMTSYKDKSIAICIIGNYENRTPKRAAIKAVKRLISYGVANNEIKSDYVLLGHQQTSWWSSCPGDSLYEMIQSWSHWGIPSEE